MVDGKACEVLVRPAQPSDVGPVANILKAPEGYVSDLFIRQSSRGKGVGSLLLEKVEGLARERGCSRLMLLNLRTRESYERGFYETAGWTERPEVANFILPL